MVKAINLIWAGENSVLDTLEHFCEDEKIEYYWCSQEWILTYVVEYKSMLSSHENWRAVLVHGFLGVTSEGNILDYDLVVNLEVFFGWVQNSVGLKDVFNTSSLRRFLWLELSLWLKVFTVVVTQVVVAHDRSASDTGTDKEISNGGLDLGLSCLEVVSNYEYALLLCKLNNSWNKCILRGSINVWASFQDCGKSKNDRRRYFGMILLDCFE